jgi:aminopeptidase-like protein
MNDSTIDTSVRQSSSSLHRLDPASAGVRAHELATELFPICRSITGLGVRQTLSIIQRELPELTIHEVPSGTKCFDWVVPDEWTINEAFVERSDGLRVIDFANHNLHIVSYSRPIDAILSLEELQSHLHSIPEMPNAIPYITSYYSERWGFCLSHTARQALQPGDYRVKIDSRVAPGSLTYGEIVLPGLSKKEVFLSTYVCHPSMANNELSGPVVTIELLKWLRSLPTRKYTYRAIFIPETIGSLVYLSRNLSQMKVSIIAGFNVTCVGDERHYSYLPSRNGDTLADRAAIHALENHIGPNGYRPYTFLDRGSDERQYCSPGVDLPIATIMRTKYGEYPEYHTSLDDLHLVTASGLAGSIEVLAKSIVALEYNGTYRSTMLGEPQLGRRGLYPTLGTRTGSVGVRATMNILAYSDGQHDLLKISNMLKMPIWDIHPITQQLVVHGLLAEIS